MAHLNYHDGERVAESLVVSLLLDGTGKAKRCISEGLHAWLHLREEQWFACADADPDLLALFDNKCDVTCVCVCVCVCVYAPDQCVGLGGYQACGVPSRANKVRQLSFYFI